MAGELSHRGSADAPLQGVARSSIPALDRVFPRKEAFFSFVVGGFRRRVEMSRVRGFVGKIGLHCRREGYVGTKNAVMLYMRMSSWANI